MAANDYIIVEGCLGGLYLAKKKKPTKNGVETISNDRRPITESEMIGCFVHYLRQWCEENNNDSLVVTSGDKKIFEATLLDKEDDKEANGKDYGIDGLWHAINILEKTLGKVSGYQTDDGLLSHQCAIAAVKKLYEQTKFSDEDAVDD